MSLQYTAAPAAGLAALMAPVAPTLLNSWVNTGGSDQPVNYFKDQLGLVHFRGRVQSGTVGAVVCTLPVGYRPFKKIVCLGHTSGAAPAGIWTIDTNGDVIASSAAGGNMSFAELYFRTDA